MSGEEEGDKSFEPSQRRLDEARRRGEVPRSADLATAAGYAGFAAACAALGSGALLAAGAALLPLLGEADRLAAATFGDGTGGGAPLWAGVLARAAGALWPFLALPAALTLLALLAQQAVVVAPERLRPQLSRISPLAAARQKLGAEGLVEFLKGLAKLLLFGLVLGQALWAALPGLLALMGAEAGPAAAGILRATVSLLWRVVLVALVLGVLDLVWQRLSFRRRHMMTRQEMVEEHRDSDGDPQLKGQRRARAVAIATNQMLAEVPKADVVIVNPTHYAVALRWDRGGGRAPVCVAKGVDDVARAIRERAAEAGVPLRSDPPTARALHATVEVGQEVGRAEWRAVAAAIRFAEKVRARKGRGW